jgi:predicted aldo/keto reductase-like oxidoreductase
MKKHKLDVTLNEIKRMKKLAGLNESAKKPLKEGKQMTNVKSKYLNVEEIARIADIYAEQAFENVASGVDVTKVDWGYEIGEQAPDSAKEFLSDYEITKDILQIFEDVFEDYAGRTDNMYNR